MKARLRILRGYFDMDQAEMARWLQTTQPMISLWESGKRKGPLRTVSGRFGVSIDWLLGMAKFQWSERVVELRQAYRRELIGLDSVALDRLQQGGPRARLQHAYQFLSQEAPELVSEEYFSRLLRLHVGIWGSEGEKAPSEAWTEACQRLSDFLDLSPNWFAKGDPSSLQRAKADELQDLVRELLDQGLTPDDLRKLGRAYMAMLSD